MIVKLLKNGVYDPKKTACICLSMLIEPPNNEVNLEILAKLNGVNLLCELINDEDDDELSATAYKCLQNLGPVAVQHLFKSLQSILSQRDYHWNERQSIIIDTIDEVERHLCTLKDLQAIPNTRDFGLQDQNDMMDQRQYQMLEKIIPVINGLLFASKENRDQVLRNG